MINRLLVIAAIILSFGIAGATGCITVEPSSSPKYTQQQIADMQAELEEVKTALAANEKQQADTYAKIEAYRTTAAAWAQYAISGSRNPAAPAVDPQSVVDSSYQQAYEEEAKLNQLRIQYQEPVSYTHLTLPTIYSV